jgi:hypothetical protein
LIKKGGRIKDELGSAGITEKSDGSKILSALIDLKSKFLNEGEDGETLINIIDQTIVDIAGSRK